MSSPAILNLLVLPLFNWPQTSGRPVQHPESSMKPCFCNGCSMWFSIVLLKDARPSLKKTYLDGSISTSLVVDVPPAGTFYSFVAHTPTFLRCAAAIKFYTKIIFYVNCKILNFSISYVIYALMPIKLGLMRFTNH